MRKGSISRHLRVLLAALLLQRKDYRGAKTHLDAVLDENWTDLHANLLFGFFYSAVGWAEMARKYFAIAKVQRMRDLQLLAPKSNMPKNYRTESFEFKVAIPDWQKNKTADESLSAKDSDLLFFDLIDFLLQNHVYGTTDVALSYIIDTSSPKYLLALAKTRMGQERYAEAT